MRRRTKIVATLGPASSDARTVRALVRAGVDVVRLNLSHGDPAEHLEVLERVRDAADDARRVVAVLADLPGPKVRAGSFPDEGVELLPGDRPVLRPGPQNSDGAIVHVDYPTLLDDLRARDRIVLGDGGVTLRVSRVDDAGATTTVVTGGWLRGRPGVSWPADRLRLATPTARDLELAELVTTAGADYVAVSFVRTAADLDAVRAVIGDRPTRVMAKIETRAAIADLERIVDAADAVMVARGDLGLELDLAEVPHLQKRIIRRCVAGGVPVITATQMLESMITAPSPTRAEVSDVANAVFDGTDAVMLSGETAIGDDPVRVVRTMAHVAARAEREARYGRWGEALGRRGHGPGAGFDEVTWAVTHAASVACDDAGAAALLCWTAAGRTARAMARFRPSVPLVGLSPDPATVRALALVWGVEPLAAPDHTSLGELTATAVERARAAGIVRTGDLAVVLAGAADRAPDVATDLLRVVRVP